MATAFLDNYTKFASRRDMCLCYTFVARLIIISYDKLIFYLLDSINIMIGLT